ncbi:MAG TPA: amidohydrolase family protein, partial [Thermomicrobiales bacterium]|nr:amidohydrolase family protein [Thermomicrobiales bacterium]
GAMNLVKNVIPQPSDEAFYRMVADQFRRFNAVGLTGLHGMDGSPDDFDFLRKMEANGDLTCRLVLPFWQKPPDSFDDMRAQLPLRDEHGRRWRAGVAKFFLDGVIDSGTGWLLEPDTKGDCTEPFWPDPNRYSDAVALFAGAGFQCATHCVGDAAVRWALDSYKAAGAAPGIRHRIEHIEQLDDADLPRFAAENVVASMQPLHMGYFEADRSDSWCVRVGPERMHRTFRTGELRASGATVALGSDWMVATYDPRIGMAFARQRRPAHAPEWPPMLPEQALTGVQTLEGYTTHAARTISEEAVSGRIAPGFRADLTAFAADPVDVAPDDLPELPVLLTVVDGEIVFQAGA